MNPKKSFFTKYIEYIKDNPNHYWFRPKLFGWGWTPATWQGWFVTLLFLFYIVFRVFYHPINDPSTHEFMFFQLELIVVIVLFLVILIIKGEKPHWCWGLSDK